MSGPADTELRQRFVDGMSHAACTVNVVTTDGPAGRSGTTVSAMSSVSADTDKPTLLVCIHGMNSSAGPILDNGVFCVNVLRDDQTHISDCFAGRTPASGVDKFACATWSPGATGAPRVADALVAFDCRVISKQKIGTHYVIFGAVESIRFDKPGSPLIYANRAYGTPLRLSMQGRGVPAEADHSLRLGVFHTFGPYVVPKVLHRLARGGTVLSPRLLEGDQNRLVEALRSSEIDLALIYDWDLGTDVIRERLVGLRPYVLLSASDPLADQSELSLRELADKPLVLLDAPPSGDFFLSLFGGLNVRPRIAYRSTSFEMVRGIVGHGLGYAILVAKPASNMTYDGHALCTRPLSDKLAPRHLALAWMGNTPPNGAAGAFADGCRALFADARSPTLGK